MLTWTFSNLTGFQPRRSPTSSKIESSDTDDASNTASASVLAPNPHLAVRRAQVLQRMFPKLSSWFASRSDSLLMSEVNEYLAQASNVTDLEQRIRVIEQQRHFS